MERKESVDAHRLREHDRFIGEVAKRVKQLSLKQQERVSFVTLQSRDSMKMEVKCCQKVQP